MAKMVQSQQFKNYQGFGGILDFLNKLQKLQGSQNGTRPIEDVPGAEEIEPFGWQAQPRYQMVRPNQGSKQSGGLLSTVMSILKLFM